MRLHPRKAGVCVPLATKVLRDATDDELTYPSDLIRYPAGSI